MANVRRAVLADIPAIVSMGADMHAESPRFRHLNFNAGKLSGVAKHLIETTTDGGVFVAEADGGLVGMFGFIVVEYFFGLDRVASDLGIYIKPEHRGTSAFPRLLHAFERATDEMGVTDKQVSAVTGVNTERVATALERLGYTRNGVNLFKRTAACAD